MDACGLISDGPDDMAAVERFQSMALRIKHCLGAASGAVAFGGACVIVPPGNSAEPIEFLLLDPKGDLAQFYSAIQSKIQLQLEDLREKQRVQQGQWR